MHDYELALLAFAKLAAIAEAKRQPIGRDKFLLLAGIAACRAGWLEVAARCHALVKQHNPRHLIGRYDSLPDALRDPDFSGFDKQLERWCPYEKAEHLLRAMEITPESLRESGETCGAVALQLLREIPS